jgi:hypothetical protein
MSYSRSFSRPFFPRSAARRGFREQIFGLARESASTVGGGPGESRTPDKRFRKPLLYPSELQAREKLTDHNTGLVTFYFTSPVAGAATVLHVARFPGFRLRISIATVRSSFTN